MSNIWTPGPPPNTDEGKLVLVRLKYDRKTFRTEHGHEYYGEPVIVECWNTKLKTTVAPLRLEYADVAEWSELPGQV